MSGRMIRIAVDAMGGDHFPDVLVEGALEAVRRYPDVEIKMVGDEKLVGDCLLRIVNSKDRKKNSPSQYRDLLKRIHLVHADEVIDMSESPGRAVRSKKNSSIVLCNKLCRSGEVDAVIAAGNTSLYRSGNGWNTQPRNHNLERRRTRMENAKSEMARRVPVTLWERN